MRFARRCACVALSCIVWFSGAVGAATLQQAMLQQQLTDFARQTIAIPDAAINVEIRASADRFPTCEHPRFSLPPGKRPGGRVSVRMMCGDSRYFIPVEIQISGRYPVAARPIPVGRAITADDLQWRQGRIDTLMALPLQAEQVIGAVTRRAIGAGQTFSDTALRRPWAVSAGQTVRATVSGNGFSIASQGKAMNNAAVNDKVRLRMESGQIIEGVVSAGGEVSVSQ